MRTASSQLSSRLSAHNRSRSSPVRARSSLFLFGPPAGRNLLIVFHLFTIDLSAQAEGKRHGWESVKTGRHNPSTVTICEHSRPTCSQLGRRDKSSRSTSSPSGLGRRSNRRTSAEAPFGWRALWARVQWARTAQALAALVQLVST